MTDEQFDELCRRVLALEQAVAIAKASPMRYGLEVNRDETGHISTVKATRTETMQ